MLEVHLKVGGSQNRRLAARPLANVSGPEMANRTGLAQRRMPCSTAAPTFGAEIQEDLICGS